ncbi:MAG TPA: hypothetical protein DD990_03105 [Cyanobacteria bacterium UBA11368]|nr:hypothetical protein [Cyanobacteria bacterium UBA11368]
MTIDINQPVRLKQILVDGTNIYYPRTYQPGELPAAYLNESFVDQGEGLVVPAISYQNSIQVQEVKISPVDPVASPTSYPGPTPVVATKKVEINKDPATAISALPGIGSAIALKVVEQREAKPFDNIEDLQTRVPLSKGSWQKVAPNIAF